jgi:hypothetical protein
MSFETWLCSFNKWCCGTDKYGAVYSLINCNCILIDDGAVVLIDGVM